MKEQSSPSAQASRATAVAQAKKEAFFKATPRLEGKKTLQQKDDPFFSQSPARPFFTALQTTSLPSASAPENLSATAPHHPPRTAPIQLYTRIPLRKQKPDHWNAGSPLRVSDDGNMAVPEGESHQFWASREIISEAAEVMEAQRSWYTLQAGEEMLRGPVPQSPKTISSLYKVVPSNLDKQTSGDEMGTTEVCSTHGMEVMGTGVRQGSSPYASGIAAVIGEDRCKWDRVAGGEDNRVKGLARDRMTGREGVEQSREESERAYENLGKRERFSKAEALGINQFAEPMPGEGLAVYSAVESLRKGFPMHFAAIVARSASDYVSFENYAKEVAQEDDSKRWYFRMYGPPKKNDDQSFYGEKVKAGKYGGIKGTMVLRHVKIPGWAQANPLFVNAYLGYSKWFAYSQIRMNQDTTPLFSAAFKPFLKAYRKLKTDAQEAWMENEALMEERYLALAGLTHACLKTEIGRMLIENPDWETVPRYEQAAFDRIWGEIRDEFSIEDNEVTKSLYTQLMQSKKFSSKAKIARFIKFRMMSESLPFPTDESKE